MKQVRPKKNLGQHFLTDLAIARRIADTVDACPDLPVLEVGPGMGVMTQFLVGKPRPLKVVEIDCESVAYLKKTLFAERPVGQEQMPDESVPTATPRNSGSDVIFAHRIAKYVIERNQAARRPKSGPNSSLE